MQQARENVFQTPGPVRCLSLIQSGERTGWCISIHSNQTRWIRMDYSAERYRAHGYNASVLHSMGLEESDSKLWNIECLKTSTLSRSLTVLIVLPILVENLLVYRVVLFLIGARGFSPLRPLGIIQRDHRRSDYPTER